MIVGIDIGTQSLKVAVTDRELQVRGEAATPYRAEFPRPGWAEQDPALWERALGPTIARALAEAGAAPQQVGALGVCGQLDGCVAVDDQGRALTRCLIWMDRRAQVEIEDVPTKLIRTRAGVVPDAGHMAAKIRWLKRHDATAATARRFHQPVSYLVQRLTDRAVMDHALASTTMLYAIDRRGFDSALLDCFEVDGAELPEVAEADSCAGLLSPMGAELTGLPAGIPIAVGTGDDFSTPLGAGLLTPGWIAVVLGTGEVVGTVHSRPTLDDSALVETHAYPGGAYFLENPGWLSGGAVAWLCELMGLDGFGSLDEAAASAPPGADGVTFIPALTGAMAPEWNAAARGCFYGLTPSHGRPHLARALLEGCSFAMRDVVERLRTMGAETGGLVLLGGGARSRLWAQMRADVTGLRIQVPHRVDASPVGAAMLAAVAAGLVADLRSAGKLAQGAVAPFAPQAANRDAYEVAYARYRRLFDSLRPMFASAVSPVAALQLERQRRELGAR
ncbi:MAG TPA: FGGY family carbohydrate kinase [Candidatus Acidoferrum sp.]|nr:FGGY family carbohydrate kinase [Candidatus Acidoferrum sp.]